MCKVLIKKVEKVYPPKNGVSDSGNKWSLWLFDCLVDVDNSGKEAVRTIKTFDAKIAEQIKAGVGKTFESQKQGEASPYSYMVNPPKKAYGGAPQKSNRQVAFESANRLVSAGLQTGCYSDPDEAVEATLVIAGKYLEFLDGE